LLQKVCTWKNFDLKRAGEWMADFKWRYFQDGINFPRSKDSR